MAVSDFIETHWFGEGEPIPAFVSGRSSNPYIVMRAFPYYTATSIEIMDCVAMGIAGGDNSRNIIYEIIGIK